MDDNKIVDSIYNVINSLFSKLFSSVDNSIYGILDKITFIDKSILESENFKKILGDSFSNGVLLICNSLVFGAILFFAINYLFSHLTLSKSQTPSQFFFKLVIFVILMNSSIWLCSEIINLVSIVSNLIIELGKSLFNQEISFSNFVTLINKEVYISGTEFNIFSFEGIAKSFTSVGFMNLVFAYALRYVLIQILVIISPFAILTLTLDKIEWFFKSWMKVFISLLLEQIFVSIILLLAFSIDIPNNPNLKQLLYIGIIYALIRANGYMYQIFGGLSTTVSTNISNFAKN